MTYQTATTQLAFAFLLGATVTLSGQVFRNENDIENHRQCLETLADRVTELEQASLPKPIGD